MRWKIVLVNGGIVLVLSLITFFLLRTSLATVVSNPQAQRADLTRGLQGAEARLSLDSLMTERWLARQAAGEAVAGVFTGGTKEARSDSATAQANQLRDRAVASPEFARMAPSLVLFVDADGVGIGRNGSELMRGDKVAVAYPGLAASLKSGNTASELWVSGQRHEQLVASYAPVRDDSGAVRGAVVIGTPLNDGRMSQSSGSDEQGLALVVGDSDQPIGLGGAQLKKVGSPVVDSAIRGARSGSFTHGSGLVEGYLVAATPLSGFPSSKAVLIAVGPASLVASIDSVLWPVLAVGILGLLLVLTGGFLLGNYISKPISEIEEGLLLVMNGQQDLRFDLEHDELGGLTSRINGLLNSVLGVPETQEGGGG